MRDSSRLILLVLITGALHVLAAWSAPMLAGEAYYWLWGKHLAAGYFDHPPMVGLAAALSFGWINGCPLAARSSSIVLAALTTLVVYALARSLYPEGRTAWRSALVFSVVPLFHAGGAMIQPDTSLMFFMSLTWLCFWKAAGKDGGPVWWLLSGVAAGLALLTKFHAWILLPPLYAWLLAFPEGRARLKKPWPWIAIAVALLVLSPNLVWNANRDWLNYTYQWRRSDLPESDFEIGNVLIYVLGPALTLTPLLYVALLAGVGKGIGRWRTVRDERVLFLLFAGLPLPVFLGVLSFVVTISLHWPSSGYIPLLILAIGLIEEGLLFGPRFYRAMVACCVAVVAAANVAIHAVNLVPMGLVSPVRGKMINTTRLRAEWNGWPEVGKVARELLDKGNRQAPTVIMARDWHLASSLAFYSERPTETFVYYEFDAHNFRLWMQERGNLKGSNAIVFILKSDPNQKHSRLGKKYDKYLRELGPLFEEVRPLPSLVMYEDGTMERYMGVDASRPRLREFLIFGCRGFKGELLQ